MMKVQWREQDIKGGRRVSKIGCEDKHLIGFIPPTATTGQHAVLIALSDGMVIARGTRADLAKTLTVGEYYPTVIDEAR